MAARTTWAATAAGLLVAAAIAIPVLDLGGPFGARSDRGARVEVRDPPVEMLAIPAVPGEGLADVTPEPRPWTLPPLGTTHGRGALAARLTVVPAAPPALTEPDPPRLALAPSATPKIRVPDLTPVELPLPVLPAREGGGSCCSGWGRAAVC